MLSCLTFSYSAQAGLCALCPDEGDSPPGGTVADQDSDSDFLPDNWELLHDRNPHIADYGIAMGHAWICVKSDSGIHCDGENVPGNSVFTESNLYRATNTFSNQNGPGDTEWIDGTITISIELRNSSIYLDINGSLTSHSETETLGPYDILGDGLVLSFLSGFPVQAHGYAGNNGSLDDSIDGNKLCYLSGNGVYCYRYKTENIILNTQYSNPVWNISFESIDATPNGVFFDSDADGIENAVDNCPLIYNVDNNCDETNAYRDNDDDGLSDIVETIMGLNPSSSDTDQDGLDDNGEDTDGDGIPNQTEFDKSMNPADPEDSTLPLDETYKGNLQEVSY